jgi:histidyl-tRNA synthetase
LREHFQFNADIIGESGVSADAELIALAIDTLRSFGLTKDDFVVRVSDRRAWQRYLSAEGIAGDNRYVAFQAIDKLEREPGEESRETCLRLVSVGQIEEILAYWRGKWHRR